ncbi:MAG TPA: hypothetical protein VKY36_01175 [Moheibacter sp.]|nr:hypothetical protein [Moheibacter sp.]
MKYLLFLNIVLFSTLLFGKKFDGYYITNENDTIEAQIRIEVNFIDPSIIKISTIKQKVSVFVNGKKKRFKPFEIKEFHIYEQGGITFKPIKLGKKSIFAKVEVEGALSVYVYGTTDLYGGMEFSNYVVKYSDKDPQWVGSKKQLLNYLNSETTYFEERFETSAGNWGDLLISFAQDYNNLEK